MRLQHTNHPAAAVFHTIRWGASGMTTLETGPTVSDSGATRLQIDQTRQTEVAGGGSHRVQANADKGNDEHVGV